MGGRGGAAEVRRLAAAHKLDDPGGAGAEQVQPQLLQRDLLVNLEATKK